MSNEFFSALLSGSINGPQSLINAGGPLPYIPSSAPAQYHAIPDGKINPPEQSRLLQGGLQNLIYAYGPNPSRLTTQTQMNIPNKVQLIIPKIFIPAATSDGSTYQDPILEHAITDGDLVFSLKMNREMVGLGSQSYVVYPQGYTDRAVKLVNLATANYILWGLQVGARRENGGRMWKNFFSHLCKSKLPAETYFSTQTSQDNNHHDQEELTRVWHFIKTYLAPYGVQHGSDMQGGQHEGSKTRVVTTNAADYVSAFAVEGKIQKMNNLWRAHDIYENDDLVLALRYMPPQSTSHIQFVLSSSNRSTRNERAPVDNNRGWWYLNPEVLEYKTLFDTPHVHVARSQQMISSFNQSSFGFDMPAWNARACIHGPPIQVTLEPCFVESDSMWFRDAFGVCSSKNSNINKNSITETMMMMDENHHDDNVDHQHTTNDNDSGGSSSSSIPISKNTTVTSQQQPKHAYSAVKKAPTAKTSKLFGMMMGSSDGDDNNNNSTSNPKKRPLPLNISTNTSVVSTNKPGDVIEQDPDHESQTINTTIDPISKKTKKNNSTTALLPPPT